MIGLFDTFRKLFDCSSSRELIGAANKLALSTDGSFGLENFTSVFQKWGEILVFEKMLNFLSFLVLLYVSGRFKQKKIFQNFSD